MHALFLALFVGRCWGRRKADWSQALEKYNIEKDIAAFIKKDDVEGQSARGSDLKSNILTCIYMYIHIFRPLNTLNTHRSV